MLKVESYHSNQSLITVMSTYDMAKSRFDTLLAATAAGDFEQFVSVGDENFKSRTPPATRGGFIVSADGARHWMQKANDSFISRGTASPELHGFFMAASF